MIDPTFSTIKRLLLQSFKSGEINPMRNSFVMYYMLLIEIKDFNALIYNKPFLDHPVKNKQELFEKNIKMS